MNAEMRGLEVCNDEPNPLPLLGISTDARGLALEIFRSIEFCEHQSRKFMGTFCILFPILYAQQCLGPNSREGKWLASLSKRRFESFKSIEADVRLSEGLPSCGTDIFGQKISSNSKLLAEHTEFNCCPAQLANESLPCE